MIPDIRVKGNTNLHSLQFLSNLSASQSALISPTILSYHDILKGQFKKKKKNILFTVIIIITLELWFKKILFPHFGSAQYSPALKI